MSVTNPAIRRKLPNLEAPNGEETDHTVQVKPEPGEAVTSVDQFGEEDQGDDIDTQITYLKDLRNNLNHNMGRVNTLVIDNLSNNMLSKETVLAFGEIRGHYMVILQSLSRDISDAEQSR